MCVVELNMNEKVNEQRLVSPVIHPHPPYLATQSETMDNNDAMT